MEYAEDESGNRIEAHPGARGYCPICKSAVLAKCGDLKIWHWSHENLEECDTWSEGETEWHRWWKSHFPKQYREVVLGSHRADIHVKGFTLELQHSAISREEIIEREDYYTQGRSKKSMAWIIDGSEFSGNVIPKHITGLEYGKEYSFRWLHPRRSWINEKSFVPKYIDTCDGHIYKIISLKLWKPKNIDPAAPVSTRCYGRLIVYRTDWFVENIKRRLGVV